MYGREGINGGSQLGGAEAAEIANCSKSGGKKQNTISTDAASGCRGE